MKEDEAKKTVCPLRSERTTDNHGYIDNVRDDDCLGLKCQWWVQTNSMKEEKSGNCAITYIAGLLAAQVMVLK